MSKSSDFRGLPEARWLVCVMMINEVIVGRIDSEGNVAEVSQAVRYLRSHTHTCKLGI